MPHDVEQWLSVLECLAAADSLEAAAAAAAQQLGTPLGAETAVFFVVLHGRIFLEFWSSEDDAVRARLRKPMLRLATEAAEGRVSGTSYHPPGPRDEGFVARVFVMPLKFRLTGVLCLVCPPTEAISPPETERAYTTLLSLVGARLATLQEVAAERTKSGQYERWFRVSDRQIRALDAERQKFAALVHSSDTSVFVADINGTIRWTSRPLARYAQASEGGNPWLGRPCYELCLSASSGEGIACGDCLVGRVAGLGAEISFVSPPSECVGHAPVRVTALPIRDLEGRAQEVMVVIEGHVLPLEETA